MGIAFRRQAKVSGIDSGVLRLLHRPQSNGLNDQFGLCALRFFNEPLEIGRFDFVVLRYGQVKAREDGPHHFQPFRIRHFMDPVHRRIFAVPQVAGYCFVGNEHTFFDNLFRQGTVPFF